MKAPKTIRTGLVSRSEDRLCVCPSVSFNVKSGAISPGEKATLSSAQLIGLNSSDGQLKQLDLKSMFTGSGEEAIVGSDVGNIVGVESGVGVEVG